MKHIDEEVCKDIDTFSTQMMASTLDLTKSSYEWSNCSVVALNEFLRYFYIYGSTYCQVYYIIFAYYYYYYETKDLVKQTVYSMCHTEYKTKIINLRTQWNNSMKLLSIMQSFQALFRHINSINNVSRCLAPKAAFANTI
jgi:hypothetical protein